MSVDIERLNQRVAALEARFASTEKKADAEPKKASEREVIAAEIEALERKLSAEDAEEKKEDEKKDDEGEKKEASLVDPNGVEEEITQKRFTEVEDLEHGTELTTDDSMLDAAPTGYVARLKKASSRLDAVAEYLEKSGRKQLAFRIDKISDAIDQRLAKLESK